jgi:hypothetical protein
MQRIDNAYNEVFHVETLYIIKGFLCFYSSTQSRGQTSLTMYKRLPQQDRYNSC